MGDAATDELAVIAGAKLYRKNAFRITGLPTDADRATIRRRQRQIVPALRAGADIDLGHDLPVQVADLDAAFERLLGNTQRRLVHELLWLWDTPGASCSCPPELHREHDKAVKAHSAVIDRELTAKRLSESGREELTRMWSKASELWKRVLDDSSSWDHVRHRINKLDDKQLDESLIDELRAELPAVLAKPLIELALSATRDQARHADQARLVEQARRWPGPAYLVEDLLEKAADPLYESVESELEEAAKLLRAGEIDRSISIVTESALPALRRLKALMPPNRHRRTARVQDLIALAYNNAASVLIEKKFTEENRKRARAWFSTAAELATEPRTERLIQENCSGMEQAAKALADIKAQVNDLLLLGRADMALRMLRDLRWKLRDTSLASEIDRLIAWVERESRLSSRVRGRSFPTVDDILGGGVPVDDPLLARIRGWAYPEVDDPPRPQLVYSTGSRWRRVLATVVILGVVIFGAYHLISDSNTAELKAEKIADNAPVGTCLESETDWRDSAGESVSMIDCSQPHWGEVLGYVSLGPVPSPYPGEDQVRRLGAFECGILLAQQGLVGDRFVADFNWPDEDTWNEGSGDFENYAGCVVYRRDGQPLPTGQTVDPSRTYDDLTVRMSLFNQDPGKNAPVGSCIAAKPDNNDTLENLPIVRCDRPHWAEVLGYPVLYSPGTPWPGAAAVDAAAHKACSQVAAERRLPSEFHMRYASPERDRRDNPNQAIYGACAASRVDDKIFTGPIK